MSAAMVATETVKDAVRAACRAPSLHNIQPWRWVFDGAVLQLFLDSSRVLPTDRAGREAIIGCGAALDHFRVAMCSAGLRSDVERFPNPNDPDHLASIRVARMAYVTDGHRRRAAAIWERRSDRLPLQSPADWELFEPVLRNRLGHHDVHLDVLGEDARPRLVQASQLAESLRLYDSTYHAELRRWTVPFEESAGIPYSALATASEGGRMDIGRKFPAVHHAERRNRIQQDQSTIVVLSTDSDTRRAALTTGEALSAVLLECTMAGLATCPLTHLTEVQVAREIVETLVGGDAVPQVLIRIGHAPATDEPPPRTPRRPLDDVLELPGG
ncbi:putative NAD(P)H nitroreductase acg [Mycolicibacter terrae]|uniref:NAD(P)H nitroreductase acg n=1 Tax=Mycolicibacter terrae TaxID=1788 RepID=A0AAD1HXF2_9MYCO|nr:nitroreductase family protein [Mycolicibacter terrae]ORW96888.1 NAD(P)H nitroreductase [Mycolicibacter terrae]BBX22428.1 putative NAD(P)H nitroreductase acg [Mycolicibacter terrae]SNV75516.1 Putative NAD(P)H nitroreductase Acg [Mycolicibacter terrae]